MLAFSISRVSVPRKGDVEANRGQNRIAPETVCADDARASRVLVSVCDAAHRVAPR